MKVEKVKELKKELERELFDKIVDFNKQTGLCVKNIEVNTLTVKVAGYDISALDSLVIDVIF